MGKSKFNKMACANVFSSDPQPHADLTATCSGFKEGSERAEDVHSTDTGAVFGAHAPGQWEEKQSGETETMEPAETGSSLSPASQWTESGQRGDSDGNLEAILLSLLRQSEMEESLAEKGSTEANEAPTRASTDAAEVEMDSSPEPDSKQEFEEEEEEVEPEEPYSPEFDPDSGFEVAFQAGAAPPTLPFANVGPEESELSFGGIESLPMIEQSAYALQPAQSTPPSMPPPPSYQAPLPMQPLQFTNCYSGTPSWPAPVTWPGGHENMQSASAQAMLGMNYPPSKGGLAKDASWHLAWCADYYKSQEHLLSKAEIHQAVNSKGGVVVPFWTPRAMMKWLNSRVDVPYAMLTDVQVLDTFVKAIASSGKNRPLRKPVHIFVFRYSEDASDALRHVPSFHQKGTAIQFNETGFRELASQCVLLVLGLR